MGMQLWTADGEQTAPTRHGYLPLKRLLFFIFSLQSSQYHFAVILHLEVSDVYIYTNTHTHTHFLSLSTRENRHELILK